MTRKERLTKLAKQYRNCDACKLADTRRHVVMGEGPLTAKLMLIGEAPGKTENLFGRPFVGESGRILRSVLGQAMDEIDKPVRYYLTNAVACRPCHEINGPNVTPALVHIEACRERLIEEIDIIKPRAVLFVGRIAEKACKKVCAGRYVEHPASFLRRGGFSGPLARSYVQTFVDALKEVAS